MDRLRSVGLLVGDRDGYEDDALFAAGVGFTDIVKRPTRRGHEPYAAESMAADGWSASSTAAPRSL